VPASARLLGSEMRLILGRRRNRAGVLVLAAVPILIAVAIRISGPGDSGEGPTLISAVTSNGIFVALTAMSVEMALFLPLAVAVLSGDTIAGEANLGTLRYLLTVPVDRTRLLLVKYVSLVIGALIGVAVVAGTGLVVGGALLGLGPTTLLSGTQVGLADALGRLAIVVLYLSAGLAALAAIGLFISTLTEQPIAATVAMTRGLWVPLGTLAAAELAIGRFGDETPLLKSGLLIVAFVLSLFLFERTLPVRWLADLRSQDL